MTGGASGRWWRRYAAVLVRLRWLVVLLWLAAAASTVVLPTASSGDGDLEGFGAGNPAIAAELRSFELFGFPLLSRVVLVQHDPDGLSAFAQAEAVLRAQGRKGAARRAVVDQAAAVLILQHALDTERSSGQAPGEIVEEKP